MEDAAVQTATAMAKTLGTGGVDDLSAYNLDDYDEEESKGAGELTSPLHPWSKPSDDATHDTAMGAFSNIKGLSYYGDNADDPYVTLEAVSFVDSTYTRPD